MNSCIIAIGSNIEPERNIERMLVLLGANVKILQVSKMIKTEPIGIKNQADFVNGAVKLETDMEMNKLDECLKNIEDQLGRDRTEAKFGPRTIDLDILVFNNKVVDEDFYTRDFLRKSAKELGFTAY